MITTLPVTRIGKYQILSSIGEGGMAKVYKAQRFAGAQPVAIKELKSQDQKDIDMFKREARILEKTKDSQFFPEYREFFQENGNYYLVMEYIEGQTLNDLIKANGVMAESEVKQIGLDVLEALSYLHKNGFIYRDVKPKNIMLTPEGKTKIIDFGIARPKTETDGQTKIGTPDFAPPEQYSGMGDERSDFYTLGKTLYFLLTGRDFEYFSFFFKPLRKVKPDASKTMEMVITKATKLDPKDRFQTTMKMKKALLAVRAEPANLQLLANPAVVQTTTTKPTGRLVKCQLWHVLILHRIILTLFCVIIFTLFIVGAPESSLGFCSLVLVMVMTCAIVETVCGWCSICRLIKIYYAFCKKSRNIKQAVGKIAVKAAQTIKKLWAGVKWGTWEDAKDFFFTPWPMIVFTLVWFALWTLGKLIFYTEMMNWSWIIYLGLLWPAILMAIWLIVEYGDAFLSVLGVTLILLTIIFIPVSCVTSLPSPPCFTITGQPIMAGRPSEINWQYNSDVEGVKFYLIFPENRLKLALPMNVDSISGGKITVSGGKITVTFRKKTAMRFLAVDYSRQKMDEQTFLIEPIGKKKIKTKDLKIEL